MRRILFAVLLLVTLRVSAMAQVITIGTSGSGGGGGTGTVTSIATTAPITGGTITTTGTIACATCDVTGTDLTQTSLTLSGNQSVAAWTTNGVRLKGVAGVFTDTTSSGTVAAAYTNVLGGNTIAASSAATFTNYISSYYKDPVAGTNVTLTNKWALGADSLRVGTSNQLAVTTTGNIIQANGIGAAFQVKDSTGVAQNVFFQDSSNILVFNSTTAGGTAGTLVFQTGSATAVSFAADKTASFRGNIIFNTDNTYDIGAPGATRPRNVYVAGTGNFGQSLTSSSGVTASGGNGFILSTVGRLYSPTTTTGQFNLENNINTTGVGLDIATDSTLKIRNRAHNADAAITAGAITASGIIKGGGYQSSDGTAGATVTTCTAFKNGLCISGT